MVNIAQALQQSFNEDYNRLVNREISTTEASQVADIFKDIENATDCTICCDDTKPCIKCIQCTAYYCEECFVKIASDFSKCSSCSIDIKKNYSKFKSYNKELQDKKIADENAANAVNAANAANAESFIDYYGSYISQDLRSLYDTSFDITSESSTDDTVYTQEFLSSLQLSRHNNLNGNTLSNINILDKQRKIFDDMRCNNILNIIFKSYITIVSPDVPNFKSEWCHDDRLLIFYPLCNQKKDLSNIVLKYNILDGNFQARLYPLLIEILKLSITSFKIKWNAVASKVNSFTCNNENERCKLLKEIKTICITSPLN